MNKELTHPPRRQQEIIDALRGTALQNWNIDDELATRCKLQADRLEAELEAHRDNNNGGWKLATDI